VVGEILAFQGFHPFEGMESLKCYKITIVEKSLSSTPENRENSLTFENHLETKFSAELFRRIK
jgi:hypothetical protein